MYMYITGVSSSISHKYHIAGNFRGRKLSRIGKKYDFRRQNFRRLLTLLPQRTPHPQILQRKLLRIATKLRNSWKVFSLESFPVYGIIAIPPWIHIQVYTHMLIYICTYTLITHTQASWWTGWGTSWETEMESAGTWENHELCQRWVCSLH